MRSVRPRSLLRLLSALALTTVGLVALPEMGFAQGSIPTGPQAARAEAKRLFGEGEDAYRRGDFDKAVDAWQKAYDLSREPVIFENIANAYERLGRPREAKEALDKWRQVAPSDEHEILDQRLRNLAARIAKLDEEERERAKKKAEEGDGEKKDDPPKPIEKPEDGGGGLSVPGLVVGGVGAGLVVAGVILDIVAGTGRPDEAEVCRESGDGQICSAAAKDDIDATNTMAIVGDVLWITGAAAVAAGVVIILVDQPSGQAEAPPVSVVPIVSPTFAGVAVGGRF